VQVYESELLRRNLAYRSEADYGSQFGSADSSF
jgi:hypothetical protein